uniref:Uncharacterized protein n=1 Tax=Macrostomum lignano TaxID=282301 RepID=A0A1I8IFB2_9PLAT
MVAEIRRPSVQQRVRHEDHLLRPRAAEHWRGLGELAAVPVYKPAGSWRHSSGAWSPQGAF